MARWSFIGCLLLLGTIAFAKDAPGTDISKEHHDNVSPNTAILLLSTAKPEKTEYSDETGGLSREKIRELMSRWTPAAVTFVSFVIYIIWISVVLHRREVNEGKKKNEGFEKPEARRRWIDILLRRKTVQGSFLMGELQREAQDTPGSEGEKVHIPLAKKLRKKERKDDAQRMQYSLYDEMLRHYMLALRIQKANTMKRNRMEHEIFSPGQELSLTVKDRLRLIAFRRNQETSRRNTPLQSGKGSFDSAEQSAENNTPPSGMESLDVTEKHCPLSRKSMVAAGMPDVSMAELVGLIKDTESFSISREDSKESETSLLIPPEQTFDHSLQLKHGNSTGDTSLHDGDSSTDASNQNLPSLTITIQPPDDTLHPQDSLNSIIQPLIHQDHSRHGKGDIEKAEYDPKDGKKHYRISPANAGQDDTTSEAQLKLEDGRSNVETHNDPHLVSHLPNLRFEAQSWSGDEGYSTGDTKTSGSFDDEKRAEEEEQKMEMLAEKAKLLVQIEEEIEKDVSANVTKERCDDEDEEEDEEEDDETIKGKIAILKKAFGMHSEGHWRLISPACRPKSTVDTPTRPKSIASVQLAKTMASSVRPKSMVAMYSKRDGKTKIVNQQPLLLDESCEHESCEPKIGEKRPWYQNVFGGVTRSKKESEEVTKSVDDLIEEEVIKALLSRMPEDAEPADEMPIEEEALEPPEKKTTKSPIRPRSWFGISHKQCHGTVTDAESGMMDGRQSRSMIGLPRTSRDCGVTVTPLEDPLTELFADLMDLPPAKSKDSLNRLSTPSSPAGSRKGSGPAMGVAAKLYRKKQSLKNQQRSEKDVDRVLKEIEKRMIASIQDLDELEVSEVVALESMLDEVAKYCTDYVEGWSDTQNRRQINFPDANEELTRSTMRRERTREEKSKSVYENAPVNGSKRHSKRR